MYRITYTARLTDSENDYIGVKTRAWTLTGASVETMWETLLYTLQKSEWFLYIESLLVTPACIEYAITSM